MKPVVTKRRIVDPETGQTVEGMSSVRSRVNTHLKIRLDWDLVFQDDEKESNPISFKFLQMAHAHAKKAAEAKKAGEGGGGAVLAGFAPASSATSKPQPMDEDASSGEE